MIWNSFDYAPIITMVVLYQIITILTSSLRTKQNYGQKRDPRFNPREGMKIWLRNGKIPLRLAKSTHSCSMFMLSLVGPYCRLEASEPALESNHK